MRRRVEIAGDLDQLAERGADAFVQAATRALARGARFRVALCGGSTPRPLYERIGRAYRDRIDWARVDLLFGDERCVPPEHPDSNYGMVKETLLARIPAARVYRMQGELPPSEAAHAYERLLREVFDVNEGFPALDLALLGMGRDGHTASLFPDTPALSETRRLVVSNPVPKLHADRLTLTVPMLSAAHEAVVLVAGSDKAPALAIALESPTEALPIQRIAAGEMLWLIDRSAASALQSPPAH